jgi:hypothetical protein
LKVGEKASHFTKDMKDCLKVLDIFFEGGHKDRHVVCIKRSMEHIAPSLNIVKEAMHGSNLQDL